MSSANSLLYSLIDLKVCMNAVQMNIQRIHIQLLTQFHVGI